METAQLAGEVLGCPQEIVKTQALLPGCDPEEIWDEIRTHRRETAILLAGHEPLFGYLTAHLLAAPSLLFDFKKGTLVRIDVDSLGQRPRGILKWILTAKLAAAGKWTEPLPARWPLR